MTHQTEPETQIVTDLSADLRKGGAADAAPPRDPSDAATLASWRDYVSLMKPRVMTLVLFTGLAGFAAAPAENSEKPRDNERKRN